MNILGYSDESVLENNTLVMGNLEIESEKTLIVKKVDIYQEIQKLKVSQNNVVSGLQYQIDQLKEVIKNLTDVNLHG
jgi:hypothetical protein